jgi:outer membrane receptor protein involved in Fe transport
MPSSRHTPALQPLARATACLFLACNSSGMLAAEEPPPAAVVTVTGTREQVLLAEAPASIGIVPRSAIAFTAPAHPQQILGQVPGVAVAVTNGEGHTTAIRQPLTTGPLYLYLEDGVPTRATGFFNHNALYEVNIPAAAAVEVVRGPNTALYGSDAIGGTVNVLTRAPSADAGADVRAELGSFGWRRLLAGGSTDGAVRGDVNVTHSDGWRDATGYDRASANLRWDAEAAGAHWKTIVGATTIDQQTGANAPLVLDDYLHNPTRNPMAIAYRKVDALRVSTEANVERGSTLWTLTPYLRRNTMELNGTFNLASDPRIEHTDVTSLGVLAKARHDWDTAWRPRLIVGVDVDRSRGRRSEDGLLLQRSGSGASTVYTGYALGARIYDYDVTTTAVSPYLHGEVAPTSALQLTVGLRHDRMAYRMTNRIGSATTQQDARIYGQQPAADVDFSHTSPKLGLTYALSPSTSLYASANHGFRTPSEGQLFRAGSAANAGGAQSKAALALQLKPIKADQLELGARGQAGGWGWDAVAYELIKRDDLVGQRDLATNVSTSVNAGKTRHRGVELGLHRRLSAAWQLDSSLSYAVHRYVDWNTASADFSGKEMESAPRTLANTRLGWTPHAGTQMQLEWVRVGSYWLEASNSAAYGKYGGHDVFNLRVRHAVNANVAAYARITNLADKRHAESASVTSNTPVYAPALPRALAVGLEASW